MKNILHILTDKKFHHLIEYFESEYFKNDSFFIGVIDDEKYTYNIQKSKKWLDESLKIIKEYDIIVMYDLDFFKSYLTNRISKEKIILWRFFGLELYHRIPTLVFSEQTKLYAKKRKFYKDILKQIYFLFKYQVNREVEFKKALKRINYFIGLSKEEYKYLKEKFNIPEFIQAPYPTLNYIESDYRKGEKINILIGNNRSAYNNHLEVIDVLSKHKNINKYLFLNYGVRDNYFKKVLEKILNKEDYFPIQDFLTKEEFNSFFEKLDVFVLNGYRQMAVANIFTALSHGVKVYLNKKNKYLDFLVNNGFSVFDIDNLEIDIRENNLKLSIEDKKKIKVSLVNLKEKYSIQNFIETIKKL